MGGHPILAAKMTWRLMPSAARVRLSSNIFNQVLGFFTPFSGIFQIWSTADKLYPPKA